MGKPNATVRGLRVFDPRDGEWKVSDNAALILADQVAAGSLYRGVSILSDGFWEGVARLADVCDQEVWVPEETRGYSGWTGSGGDVEPEHEVCPTCGKPLQAITRGGKGVVCPEHGWPPEYTHLIEIIAIEEYDGRPTVLMRFGNGPGSRFEVGDRFGVRDGVLLSLTDSEAAAAGFPVADDG